MTCMYMHTLTPENRVVIPYTYIVSGYGCSPEIHMYIHTYIHVYMVTG